MQAIISTSGTQVKVEKGSKIKVNRLTADVGANVDFDVVALLGDAPQFGAPTVKGAKVTAKVVAHERGEKIRVSIYKRRKGFHKTRGHRQELTQIEITDIKG